MTAFSSDRVFSPEEQSVTIFVAVDAESNEQHRLLARLSRLGGSALAGQVVDCEETTLHPFEALKLSRPTDVTAILFPAFIGPEGANCRLVTIARDYLDEQIAVGAYEIHSSAGVISGQKRQGVWGGRSLHNPVLR